MDGLIKNPIKPKGALDGKMMLTMKDPHIILLGGGTGSFTLLQALKKLTPNITAVVNMSDDGGSSGVLRDELGVLPPGDVRQCLVALSDTPEIRNLFSYRFSEGRFEGQSLGNIILSGLELQHGSFEKAVRVASEVLNITGTVSPITLEKHTLIMEDGAELVKGEYNIANHSIAHRGARLRLEPVASINPTARQAMLEADLVVIAPGNFYGSLLPIFAVDGVAATLRQVSAPIVSVANLVNKPGQTDDWHVVDYVRRLEESIGIGVISTVLYNNQPIAKKLLQTYAAEGEYPVGTSLKRFGEIKTRAVGAPLVSKEISAQDATDKLRRTLIRHDAARVCDQLAKIISAS